MLSSHAIRVDVDKEGQDPQVLVSWLASRGLAGLVQGRSGKYHALIPFSAPVYDLDHARSMAVWVYASIGLKVDPALRNPYQPFFAYQPSESKGPVVTLYERVDGSAIDSTWDCPIARTARVVKDRARGLAADPSLGPEAFQAAVALLTAAGGRLAKVGAEYDRWYCPYPEGHSDGVDDDSVLVYRDGGYRCAHSHFLPHLIRDSGDPTLARLYEAHRRLYQRAEGLGRWKDPTPTGPAGMTWREAQAAIVERLDAWDGTTSLCLDPPPGTGKTYAALRWAVRRAAEGQPVFLAEKTHRAADDAVTDSVIAEARSVGVSVRRVRGSSAGCIRPDVLSVSKALGESPQGLGFCGLCSRNVDGTCPVSPRARTGTWEVPEDGKVVWVGVHQLTAKARAVGAQVVLDERPTPVHRLTMSGEDLAALDDALSLWPDGEALRRTWHLNEPAPAGWLQNVLRSADVAPGPAIESGVGREPGSWSAALLEASRRLEGLADDRAVQTMVALAKRASEGGKGQAWLNPALTSGPVVYLDATPDSGVVKVLGAVREPVLVNPGNVRRVWIAAGCASGTSWNLARDEYLAGVRRYVAPWNPDLVGVTRKDQVEPVQELTGGAVLCMNQAEGLNEYREGSVVVTYGELLPNIGAMQADAMVMGIDPEAYPAERGWANVIQVQGRLRAVQRTDLVTMVHVGRLPPPGWTEANSERHETFPGRPVAERAGTVELEALVKTMSLRNLAKRLGIGLATVQRWRKDGVPADRIALVQGLSKHLK